MVAHVEDICAGTFLSGDKRVSVRVDTYGVTVQKNIIILTAVTI